MHAIASKIPPKVEIVIIGGGIIGCATAYYLASQGIPVALCEKGRIAGEQSSRNWGFVRQQGRDPAELPTIIESLRIWRNLSKTLGRDVGFRQKGMLYLADQGDKMSGFEDWTEHARQYQLDTRLVSGEEVKKLLPGLQGEWLGGLYTPSDGQAEPSLAAQAIADTAAELGAHILPRCAVRALDLEGGKVAGVITEHGRIACQSVLLAGGAWSSLFCAHHGVTLPQLKVRSTVFRTAPAPAVTEGSVWTSKVALRRRQDGGFTVAHGAATQVEIIPDSFKYFKQFMPAYESEKSRLRMRVSNVFLRELLTSKRWRHDRPGPFEKDRVLDPEPSRAILNQAHNNLGRVFPALAGVPIKQSWAGLIDVTPDAVPVIGEVKQIPGFYLATGFSGHGFGIGPGAGLVAAEMLSGVPGTIDRTPFALERFAA